MAIISEVRDLLQSFQSYNKVLEQLHQKIQNRKWVVSISSSTPQDKDVEKYIPSNLKETKHVEALSSLSNGNCLYSSVSILLVGDNSLVDELRALTSIELCKNSDYYVHHPYFKKKFEENGSKLTSSLKNLFLMTVSDEAIKACATEVPEHCLVQKESLINCTDCQFSSILCMLALSSVIGMSIELHYPDCGAEKFKLFFNGKIEPFRRKHSGTLDILFCQKGISEQSGSTDITVKPNHFVPLKFSSKGTKRKITSEETTMPLPKKTQTSLLSFMKKNDSQNVKKVVKLDTVMNPQMKESTQQASSLLASNKNEKIQTKIKTEKEKEHKILVSNNEEKVTVNISDSMPGPSTGRTSLENSKSFDVSTYREQSMQLSKNCAKKSIQDQVFYNRSLSHLIDNVFKPEKNYNFPGKGRHFQHNWLERFKSWLCYSPDTDGAFCLPCVLFGHLFPCRNNRLKKLYTEPFTHWNNAVNTFNDHQNGKESSLHYHTSQTYKDFLQSRLATFQPMDIQFNQQVKSEVAQNRKKLSSIIKSIKFCGRSGIALRGHRDDKKYHPEPGCFNENRVGNFIDLLMFRIEAGDTTLGEHLKNHAKNASMISKTSQNELISCCGKVILDNIVSEIKQREKTFFSVIADEASDSSNKEQMSVVLRYVDSDSKIRESFVGFTECKYGLAGKDLLKSLTEKLGSLGLEWKDCVGQAYDGAGSVAGHTKGLQALVKNINNKALYTHCHSHRLNLAVSDSCKIPAIYNVLDRVRELAKFFSISPKREECLKRQILEFDPNAKILKFGDPCRTRWVEKIVNLNNFQMNFIPMLKTLHEISENRDVFGRDASSKAASFIQLINFHFVVSLVVTRNVFDLTLSLTRLLQSRTIDIKACRDMIEALIKTLSETRQKATDFHKEYYSEALALADRADIDVLLPRIVNTQKYRENYPAETVEKYYERALTIPLLDYLLQDMRDRFQTGQDIIFDGLYIIPDTFLKAGNIATWKEKFMNFCTFYKEYFPSFLNLQAELRLWENFWKAQKDVPSKLKDLLEQTNSVAYPNIGIAIKILATLPVTSCECERSFSSLRRLKDFTRSTMLEDRLSGLALMHIHREIDPSEDKVIDEYAVRKDRRLRFN